MRSGFSRACTFSPSRWKERHKVERSALGALAARRMSSHRTSRSLLVLFNNIFRVMFSFWTHLRSSFLFLPRVSLGERRYVLPLSAWRNRMGHGVDMFCFDRRFYNNVWISFGLRPSLSSANMKSSSAAVKCGAIAAQARLVTRFMISNVCDCEKATGSF